MGRWDRTAGRWEDGIELQGDGKMGRRVVKRDGKIRRRVEPEEMKRWEEK